ncbi:hypothetical protein Vi05172_g1784 [Venturia inaequalis]|nr:hypothetical protein Vi05172_g1784 [Venturia inaequalis]
MITGIAHINLLVPAGTLDLAEAFYGNTLGLKRVPVPALQTHNLAWFDITPGGQQVHIAFGENDAKSRRHPCFKVESPEALLKLRRQIWEHFEKADQASPQEADKPGEESSVKAVAPRLFQAEVEGSATFVAIKTPPKPPASLFDNEAKAYKFPSISTSPYIRKLIEEIEEPESRCLVLEWMDTTLWATRTEPVDSKLRIFKNVARSCLNGLLAFQDMGGAGPHCHADLNPNNILVSGFSSPTPIIKISDLGWTTSTTSQNGPGQVFSGWIQGPALRAPEVWRGADRSTAMDVWSVGVCLADWVATKAHFGPGGCRIETDMPVEISQAAWSIAKLHKILNAPLAGSLKDDFNIAWGIAEHVIQENYVLDRSFREQMEQIQMPSDYISFLEKVLTVNPDRRPSPAEALALPFLQE